MLPRTNFNFIGTILLPKDDSKRPFVKEGKTASGGKYLSMMFGVKSSAANTGWVEIFDTQKEIINTFNKVGEKIEVDWEDRLDERVIDEVGYGQKYIVSLGEDEYHEFITAYDMIECLKDLLPKYKDRISVRGSVRRDYYNGTYRNRYIVNRLRAVGENDSSKLEITGVLYYNTDSLDKSEFKETKKIILDSYILQYINKEDGSQYIPFPTVFSTEKFDLNKETDVNRMNYRMGYLDNKSKEMKAMYWEMRLINGADEIEWNESMLSDAQRMQVELGIRTADYFKPRNSTVLGNRISEIRLKDPILVGEFVSGEPVDCEIEFEDNIYQPPVNETIEQAKAKSKAKKKTAAEEVKDDFDDIF